MRLPRHRTEAVIYESNRFGTITAIDLQKRAIGSGAYCRGATNDGENSGQFDTDAMRRRQ